MQKIRNRYHTEKAKKCSHGAEIYEYDYIDPKTKEVVHKKTNVQEKIQSCRGLVDYKKMIKNGEYQNDGPLGTSDKDYTTVPTDKVDIITLIDSVSKLNEEQITYLLQQTTKQTETTNQETRKTSETNNETIKEQPATSEVDTTTIKGDN